MTKCKNCDITNFGINRVNNFGEMYELCPNCGMEDTVEEVDEIEWAESIALSDADFQNELLEDS